MWQTFVQISELTETSRSVGRTGEEEDETLNANELVEDNLGLECVENAMSYLRDIGMRSRDLLRKSINEDALKKRQFVIAMLASREEITNCDYSAINQFRNILEGLGSSSEFRASQRYFRRRRVCVILNAPWSDAHGEARLMDPTGEMVSDFVDERYFRQNATKHEIQPALPQMMTWFQRTFPTENPILLIFSFHIPCTIRRFMCSNLIGEFALRNRAIHIIVAYEAEFRRTKSPLARSFMNQENVYVLCIGRDEKPNLPTHNEPPWRSSCNKNWHIGDFSLPKFSERVSMFRESRKAYRRNIGVQINTSLSISRPKSYYDDWMDDRLCAIYDYCSVFKLVSKHRKCRSKSCKNRQTRNKRQWSNPHEIFWQDDQYAPPDCVWS